MKALGQMRFRWNPESPRKPKSVWGFIPYYDSFEFRGEWFVVSHNAERSDAPPYRRLPGFKVSHWRSGRACPRSLAPTIQEARKLGLDIMTALATPEKMAIFACLERANSLKRLVRR